MINFLLISVHFPFLSKSRTPNTVKNLNKRLLTVLFINPQARTPSSFQTAQVQKQRAATTHPGQSIKHQLRDNLGPQAPNVDFLTALVGGA
jgi:hypothetical protein